MSQENLDKSTLPDKATDDSMCSLCDTEVEEHALQCKNCSFYFHYFCTELPPTQILALKQSNRVYTCAKCISVQFEKHMHRLPQIIEAIDRQKILLNFMTKGDGFAAAGDKSDTHRSVESLAVFNDKNEVTEKSSKTGAIGKRTTKQPPKGKDTIAPSGKKKDQNEPHPSSKGDKKGKRKTKICKYYKTSGCKNDEKTCDFLHPKICSRFKADGFGPKGCNPKCKSFHPHICEDSWEKGNAMTEIALIITSKVLDSLFSVMKSQLDSLEVSDPRYKSRFLPI